MNWVDTPLLVYIVVEGHPARELGKAEFRRGEWGSSVLVLLEVFQVLTRDYGVSRREARAEVEILARSPIAWAGLSLQQVADAVEVAERESISSTDAVLLGLAEKDRGVLVTPDEHLFRVAQRRGVAVRNPVDERLAAAINAWETEHLPQKGSRRLLALVARWLADKDPPLAERFREVTANLTCWPQ